MQAGPGLAAEPPSRCGELSTQFLTSHECSALALPLLPLLPWQSQAECSLMNHIPGNLPFLFCLLQPEYPWRPPCAMARSQNAQAVPGVKPVPKDLGKDQILSFTLRPWADHFREGWGHSLPGSNRFPSVPTSAQPRG